MNVQCPSGARESTETNDTDRTSSLILWLTEMTMAVFSDDDDLTNTGLFRYQIVITQPRHDQTRFQPRVLIFASPTRFLTGTAPLPVQATIQEAIDAGLRWCEEHAARYVEHEVVG